MAITCQVVTKPMRNVLRARNAHVIGLLRAYYVPHVTRYVSPPRNSHVIAHVIDLVRTGDHKRARKVLAPKCEEGAFPNLHERGRLREVKVRELGVGEGGGTDGLDGRAHLERARV